MNFTAQKSDLLRALALCNEVVERKNTIPILNNLRLSQASSNELCITATDMDMELSVTIPASFLKGAQPGITLPARTLTDIVKKATEDNISVAAKEFNAQITAGRAKFNLGTMDPAEFPAFPRPDGITEFPISIGDMGYLIDTVKHAASSEEARYYLCGIHFHLHDNGRDQMLRAVTTDGNRLAYADAPPLDARLTELPPVILTTKSCDALSKIFEHAPAPVVNVGFSKTAARFTLPGIELQTKIIDGTFPDYLRLIPQNNERIARISSETLAAVISRVACLSETTYRPVKLSFTDKGLVVSTSSSAGSAEEVVDVTDWTGDDLAIGFNSHFLLEVLGLIPGDIELIMDEPGSPVIIRSISDDKPSPGRLNLIMPMRVN